MKKIRIGHSPDADDAFMFYALTAGKIPLGGFEIEHVIEEIESLNQRALQKEVSGPASPLEVTALSCHAFGLASDRYQLIPYGASVGEGYGPVLVRKEDGELERLPPSIRGTRIAIPGQATTAHLILQLYEKDFQPVFVPFDQVFRAVKEGLAELGLVIHEGQLTYADEGFRKVIDLGAWWEERFHLPLPLGVNAILRDLGEESILGFTGLFRRSIDYAMTHREEALSYALGFGRGMDPKTGDRFVGMYVNHYALELGEKGKEALRLLYELAWKKNLIPEPVELDRLFVLS